jgi:hypothetical protein
MRLISFFVTALGVLALSPAALAQTAAAEALFEQGRTALAAGDLDTACARFRASDQMDPGAGARANLGTCEERRGRLASAWEAYRSALKKIPATDPRAAKLQEKIDALTPRLPHLEIVLGPDAPADTAASESGVVIGSAATAGLALPFDPGPHHLIVSASGHAPHTVEVVLVEGESKRIVLTAEPAPGEGTPSTGTATSGPARSGSAGPWVVGGIGLAALVGGAVTGGLTLHQKSLNDAGCSSLSHTCSAAGKDAASAGQTLGATTTALLVAGVAGVGAGALWLGLRSPSHPTTGLGLSPLVGGAALRLEASW